MVALGALITGNAQEGGSDGSPPCLWQGGGRQSLGIGHGSFALVPIV